MDASTEEQDHYLCKEDSLLGAMSTSFFNLFFLLQNALQCL